MYVVADQIVAALATCVATFAELEALVESLCLDEFLGILERLTWVRKEKDVDDLLDKLRDHKLSLTMMVTILAV